MGAMIFLSKEELGFLRQYALHENTRPIPTATLAILLKLIDQAEEAVRVNSEIVAMEKATGLVARYTLEKDPRSK